MNNRYGGFSCYSGDGKAVPLIDVWTYTLDSRVSKAPAAIAAYANWELAGEVESLDSEVFVDIHHPEFKLTVSPHEARAIAQMLNDIADFIIDGRDEL